MEYYAVVEADINNPGFDHHQAQWADSRSEEPS